MYNYNYTMQMTQGAVINHLLKRHSLICLDSIKHIIKTHSAIQKIERQVIKDKHSTASHFSWRCHCSIWLYQDLNEHNSLCAPGPGEPLSSSEWCSKILSTWIIFWPLIRGWEQVDFSVRYHMMGIQSHQQWDKIYTTHFQRDVHLTFSP